MQRVFLDLTCREALYGGAAGGGKSSALLMAALQYVDVPGYAALLLRRTYADLNKAGALMDRAQQWLRNTPAKWDGTRHMWLFPSGATLSFGYMETEADRRNYDGAEYQMVGWDELTQFCYNEAVETLTEDGWKLIKDVQVGERVLAMAPDWTARYETVTAAPSFDYDGDLHETTSRSIRYSVTPNHRMIIRPQRTQRWEFREAQKLPPFPLYPFAAKWQGEERAWIALPPVHGHGIGRNQNSTERIAADDYLALLGWYLAEGSSYLAAKSRGGTSPCVNIRQTRDQPELAALMDRLPYRVRHTEGEGYRIFSRQLFDHFKPMGDTYSKRVPRWVMWLSQRQLNIFLHAFALGDGHFLKTGAIDFGLANEGLVDDLQEIATKVGRRATKGFVVVRGEYPSHRLYIHGRDAGDVQGRPEHKRTRHYRGKVYCLTVEPSHTMLCRYEGRVFWSGNSETQYRYLFTRLRRLAGVDIPIRMRGATNPIGEGRAWVHQRFLIEGPDKGRVFVPAKLEDNPHVDLDEYDTALAELDPVLYAQMRTGNWEIAEPGVKFQREWWDERQNPGRIVATPPANLDRVRYWDLASTEPRLRRGRMTDPDWTVGALVGRHAGVYYVLDLVRFRGTPLEVQARIKATAQADRRLVPIYIEQEPGSNAAIAMDHYRRSVLDGYDFHAVRSTGSKELRANPLSAAAEAGNVRLVRAPWLTALLDELCAFPNGTHDDQVDAVSGAYTQLAARARRSAFSSAVGPPRPPLPRFIRD